MRTSRAVTAVALALLAVPVAAYANEDPGCLAFPASSEPLIAELVAQDPLIPGADDGEPEPRLHACWGKIQPGSQMTAPYGCTMNWIFQDEDGAYYIGTAGHCLGASGSNGRSVSIWGVGPIGTSVYNINAGVGRDFGLVKINPELYDRIDPSLCHWGGPNGLATFEQQGGIASGSDTLLHYGFGVLFNSAAATRARVHETTGPSASSFNIEGLISSGDSGSPVMLDDGRAAGVVTHAQFWNPTGILVGPGYAQRLDVGIALAEAATGKDFTLVTSDVPVSFPLGTA